MDDLKELIAQYEGGLLTPEDFWGKVVDLGVECLNDLYDREDSLT